MWVEENLNPVARSVQDCAVRAVAKALETDWETAYIKMAINGYKMGDMPSANTVWGALLRENGYYRAIPEDCPDCPTVSEFAEEHPIGAFVLGLDRHVVTLIDGNYYDIWDSGDEPVIYYWYKKTEKGVKEDA